MSELHDMAAIVGCVGMLALAPIWLPLAVGLYHIERFIRSRRTVRELESVEPTG